MDITDSSVSDWGKKVSENLSIGPTQFSPLCISPVLSDVSFDCMSSFKVAEQPPVVSSFPPSLSLSLSSG